MREINVQQITDAVKTIFIETNYRLGEDVKRRIEECHRCEESQLAKDVFDAMEQNLKIAEEGVFPICQDTGMPCVFLEIGQDVHLVGGDLKDAVNEGARQGCLEGYLRKTIVQDPFRRVNTGDSTPADIIIDIIFQHIEVPLGEFACIDRSCAKRCGIIYRGIIIYIKFLAAARYHAERRLF